VIGNRFETSFNKVQEVKSMAEIQLRQSGIKIYVPYGLLIAIANNTGDLCKDNEPV